MKLFETNDVDGEREGREKISGTGEKGLLYSGG